MIVYPIVPLSESRSSPTRGVGPAAIIFRLVSRSIVAEIVNPVPIVLAAMERSVGRRGDRSSAIFFSPPMSSGVNPTPIVLSPQSRSSPARGIEDLEPNFIFADVEGVNTHPIVFLSMERCVPAWTGINYAQGLPF